MVGTAGVRQDPAFLRDGCSCRGQVLRLLEFVFGNDASKKMEVFGRYIEVTPPSRLVWTNDEGDEGGAVTTVTFEEKGAQTLLVIHDLYPSKEALDAAIASGSADGMPETLGQLDELLVTLGARRGTVIESSVAGVER